MYTQPNCTFSPHFKALVCFTSHTHVSSSSPSVLLTPHYFSLLPTDQGSAHAVSISHVSFLPGHLSLIQGQVLPSSHFPLPVVEWVFWLTLPLISVKSDTSVTVVLSWIFFFPFASRVCSCLWLLIHTHRTHALWCHFNMQGRQDPVVAGWSVVKKQQA